MVASLTRAFGPSNLQLVEEVVQESLIQAMRHWPFHGVPDRPGAWLQRVARNLALDRIRRETTFREKELAIRDAVVESGTSFGDRERVTLSGELDDDRLRLVFLCCHPELPRDGRVALTLKNVCGFGVPEIARAFLVRETTIAQRLVRAQRRIRERQLRFEVPEPAALPERVETVLEVLYLMFNEGYAPRDGTDLIRDDLCHEALQLTEHVCAHAVIANPEAHALAALMHFQTSRLPARLDERGNLVLLADQKRGLWNPHHIRAGFVHLEKAGTGERCGSFHLQAGIAAQHASAESDEKTDWSAILAEYDRLVTLDPSPIVALNRVVALSKTKGAGPALEALDSFSDHPAIRDYHLLHATRAELLRQTGNADGARMAYREALRCPCSRPERRFLLHRLNSL